MGCTAEGAEIAEKRGEKKREERIVLERPGRIRRIEPQFSSLHLHYPLRVLRALRGESPIRAFYGFKSLVFARAAGSRTAKEPEGVWTAMPDPTRDSIV